MAEAASVVDVKAHAWLLKSTQYLEGLIWDVCTDAICAPMLNCRGPETCSLSVIPDAVTPSGGFVEAIVAAALPTSG